MTTIWPMPAAVVPPATGPRSRTRSLRPARAHGAAQAAPTMPAPTMIRSKDALFLIAVGILADAPTERITLIQQQGGLGIDKGGASNGGSDFSRRAVQPAKSPRKGAAEDAFLDPGFALFEFCVGGEAGKFGAGAGAARGAVIGLARALNKIARVGARDGSRAEEFDMIDLRKALGIDCLANTP